MADSLTGRLGIAANVLINPQSTINPTIDALDTATTERDQLRRERDARPDITIEAHQQLLRDLAAVQVARDQAILERNARPDITMAEYQRLLRDLAAVQAARDQAILERNARPDITMAEYQRLQQVEMDLVTRTRELGQARQERDDALLAQQWLRQAQQNTETAQRQLALDLAAPIRTMTEAELFLVQSAEIGDVPGIETAIARGAALHTIDRRAPNSTTFPNAGADPLNLAALNGHLEAVRYLLDHGVNIETRNLSSCGTPMHHAAHHGHINVMELLWQRGANINPLDHISLTPLHYAVYYNYPAAVRWLLEHGANSHAVSSDYKGPYLYRITPQEIAVAMHNDRGTNPAYDRTEILRVFAEIVDIPGNRLGQPGVPLVNQFDAARLDVVPRQAEQQAPAEEQHADIALGELPTASIRRAGIL